MRDLYSFEIVEKSQIYEARRIISAFAKSLDFTETEIGKITLLITEVCTNIIKHAKSGELLIRSVRAENINGLEFLALDKGPGINNLEESLKDKYSTKGTLGIGLGAIKRSSTLFDIYTQPNKGTAVLFRMWSKPLPYPLKPRPLEIGVVAVPKNGEEISGDSWFACQRKERSLIAVVDGIGHGLLAAEAAHQAVVVIEQFSELSPSEILEKLNDSLKNTRGAAIAIIEFLFNKDKINFCGVGNINTKFISFGEKINKLNLVSSEGIVGYQFTRIKELTYPFENSSDSDFFILVMHSDGVSTRWDLSSYPGLYTRHPSLIAGVLYRDYSKHMDDITIITARKRKGNLREP